PALRRRRTAGGRNLCCRVCPLARTMGPGRISIMSETALQLRSQLAMLSAQDRAELAHFLLRSLDEEADPDAAEAWHRELAERLQQIKSGKAVGESAAKVFA